MADPEIERRIEEKRKTIAHVESSNMMDKVEVLKGHKKKLAALLRQRELNK